MAACVVLIFVSYWISKLLWKPAEWGMGIGALLLFFVLPIFFLLTGKDLLEHLQYEGSSGFLPRFLRIVLSGPIGCLGICMMLLGVALPTWIIWNLFDPQDEFVGSPWVALFMVGLFLAAIPIGWYVLRLAVGRKVAPTRADEEEEERKFREELTHPDFSAVESAYGKPFPEAFRALYEGDPPIAVMTLDHAVIYPMPGDEEEWIGIATFLPVSTDLRCNEIGDPDENGSWYCLAITVGQEGVIFQADASEPPVFLIDGDERIQLAESPIDFCRHIQVAD